MELVFYLAGMLALGAGAGLMSAALGLGGGVIMVPAFLTFVHGMDEHTATGTSLFIIVFIALCNAWRLNHGTGDIPWRPAAVLATGSIAGGFGGKWFAAHLPGDVVLVLFLALVLGIGLRTLLRTEPRVEDRAVRRRNGLALAIGFVAGLAGGATGTGGGALLVPLALLAGIVSNHRVSGLSNLVMVATSAAGAAAALLASRTHDGLYTVGHVELSLVPFVFVGAQLGSPLGMRVNALLTLPRRRLVLGGLLLLIAARIIVRLLA